MVIFASVGNTGEMRFVTLRVPLDLTETFYALEIFPFFNLAETPDRPFFFWRGGVRGGGGTLATKSP